MTRQEVIENLGSFINHFNELLNNDEHRETLDIEQIEKDIESFKMAIRSLEAWDEVVDELLHIDKPTDFGGYEDGAYDGVTLAIRTINKRLSEVN